jgi:hypothetical protein
MLHHLKLRHVGPAPELDIDFAPRMNFLTGDNGLGKSFLLDIAWWALTEIWAQMPAAPHRDAHARPIIEASFDGKRTFSAEPLLAGNDDELSGGRRDGTRAPAYVRSTYDRAAQGWVSERAQLPSFGLVIYAQSDGGFSVWDRARNYQRQVQGRVHEAQSRPAAYIFQRQEVWNGLPQDEPRKLCNGLIHDWAAWQREKGQAFDQLTRVLQRLSPSPDEPLVPGELQRVSLDDVRDQPALQTPYGQQVALVHASAAMRQIVALAYLLVWTWNEHLRASEIVGQEPASEIIFLIDEIEAHLHPRWQRRIVPALLDVIETLTGTQDVSLQLIVATHSPLVLASVEPYFDLNQDALWELDLEEHQVKLKHSPWRRRGDVNNWLSSEIFDLGEPRSLEAEAAMQRALTLLRGEQPPALEEIESVDAELRKVLSDVDRFWVRWSAFVQERRAAP